MVAGLCIVISCEHGGNRVPPRYRELFPRGRGVLQSHRGWDPGALQLARTLARGLGARLFQSTVTRLLVDLNRSAGHPALYSRYSRGLPAQEKQRLLQRYYHPYRQALEDTIAQRCQAGDTVLHLSAHSFCPRLRGHTRRADLGLLYDPARSSERAFCQLLKTQLQVTLPGLRLRRNYPYRGAADGLTTWLRRCFPETRYLGIELEVNQRLVSGPARRWLALRQALVAAIGRTTTRYLDQN